MLELGASVRTWLRVLPLVALTLGLTWSGGRASADDIAPAVASDLPPAPQLPAEIVAEAPQAAADPDFRFTSVRRF